jgi:hypothetical protein
MIMSLTPDSGLSESWRCSAEALDRLIPDHAARLSTGVASIRKGVTNDKETTVSAVVCDYFDIRPPDWHPG